MSESKSYQDKSYQDINAETIDRWVEEGWQWGTPICHEVFVRAQQGDWDLVLTPTKPVPRAWFGELEGARVLGLACGGGQQMPILTAVGARCTVLDNSPAMLEADRLVAQREGYAIDVVRADMTKPLPFADASFDLVINPVSVCYVQKVEPIWREVARVLAPGGALLTGFEYAINQLVDDDEEKIVRAYPANPLVQPDLAAELAAGDFGMQFSHGFDDLLGGMLRAGLTIRDLYEDTNGEGRLHELGIPTMMAVRATKG